jgi:hypothetical protein
MQLAQIGRARALLDTNDYAGAAAAANGVALTFAYTPPYDGVNQINAIFQNISQLAASVSNIEGVNGIDFVSASDPRVSIAYLGPSPSTGDSVYSFVGYTSLGSPIVLASGIEAQLIAAEAALRSGNVPQWAATLNALRASDSDTALSHHPIPLDSTVNASPALQQATMFRERALWLFGSGHRHGDLRRLIEQYHLAVESTFPTGLYQHSGRQYGTSVVFLPFGEETNPQYTGCSDDNP